MKVLKNSTKYLMAVFVIVIAASVFCIGGTTAKAAGVTQTDQTSNSITVSWPAESEAIEYYVSIGSTYSEANQAVPVTVSASSTSYKFTGLQAGTEYTVLVKYSYQGYSQIYTSYIGSGNIKTLPDKVSGINQTNWYYYIQAVNFAWTDQPAADYEYVIRNSKNKVVAKSTSLYNHASLSKANNNMVYNVQVRAYVKINGRNYYGQWSDKAYLFMQPMIKQAKISGGKLKISWNKVSGVTGYDVYVSTKQKSGYKKVKSLSSKKSSLTVSKLKGKKFNAKKKYYIYVVGKKKVGKKTYTSGILYTYKLTRGKNVELKRIVLN